MFGTGSSLCVIRLLEIVYLHGHLLCMRVNFVKSASSALAEIVLSFHRRFPRNLKILLGVAGTQGATCVIYCLRIGESMIEATVLNALLNFSAPLAISRS